MVGSVEPLMRFIAIDPSVKYQNQKSECQKKGGKCARSYTKKIGLEGRRARSTRK